MCEANAMQSNANPTLNTTRAPLPKQIMSNASEQCVQSTKQASTELASNTKENKNQPLSSPFLTLARRVSLSRAKRRTRVRVCYELVSGKRAREKRV